MKQAESAFMAYIKDSYFLGEYGVVHEKEIPFLCEQFGIDEKKLKQELKIMGCEIFKTGGKINEKNIEWDKLSDIKLGKGHRTPKYAQGLKIETAAGRRIWDRIREELIKEYSCTCQICGYHGESPGELDAHEIWEYDEENCVLILKEIKLICKRCHGCFHPENAAMVSIKNDERKGIERAVPKSQVLDIHLMRVNGWNLDTFKQYQKTFSEEKSKLMMAEMVNARSKDPAAVRKRELNNMKWKYHIEADIPLKEEVIQKIKEKDLYFIY